MTQDLLDLMLAPAEQTDGLARCLRCHDARHP